KFLVVFGWADSPLAKVADVALPGPTHVEKSGTFVNVEKRVQRFEAACPPPGQDRPLVDVLCDLLGRFEQSWPQRTPGAVFDKLAAEIPAFAGITWESLPATGAPLHVAGAPPDAETGSRAEERE